MARDDAPLGDDENLGANSDEDGASLADRSENLGANSGDDAVAVPEKKPTATDAS